MKHSYVPKQTRGSTADHLCISQTLAGQMLLSNLARAGNTEKKKKKNQWLEGTWLPEERQFCPHVLISHLKGKPCSRCIRQIFISCVAAIDLRNRTNNKKKCFYGARREIYWQ